MNTAIKWRGCVEGVSPAAKVKRLLTINSNITLKCMGQTYLINVTDLKKVKFHCPTAKIFAKNYFDDSSFYKESILTEHKVWTDAGTIFERIIDIAAFSEQEKCIYFTFFSNLFWLSFSEEEVLYISKPWRDDLNYFKRNTERQFCIFSINNKAISLLLALYSQIDFSRLECLASTLEHWQYSRNFSNFNDYKRYIDEWIELFKFCISKNKDLLITIP